MARIVLNTFGSFGDLHPYLAVAIELKSRGHHVVLATAEVYRAKVEGEGIAFAPVRPNLGELIGNKQMLEKLWHPRRGSEYLIRDYVMPAVADSYEDLLPICNKADLLLTHLATFAAPIVAETLKIRWLSIALQPAIFLSRFDPPVLAPAPWLHHFSVFGPTVTGAILNFAKRQTAGWTKPVADLRKRLALPRSDANPIFEGQFSPFGTQAWFSRHFAQGQRDWPSHTCITGFPFYDKRGKGFEKSDTGNAVDEMKELRRFLDDGTPPVLFTLGSSAVMHPGSFYQESLQAATKLGVRAILLAGLLPRDAFPPTLPPSIFIASYAPYSEIMPLCTASVHQGGIGTTAQALRSGRPMIVVPWAHDQPDNAYRITQIGVGRTVPRSRYSAPRVAHELNQLLKTENYAKRAKEVGERISSENGIKTACDGIEKLLREC